jgi:hypothetical protein
MATVFLICPLFEQTFKEKLITDPVIKQKFIEFRKIKEANHIAPFGASDKLFKPSGNFGSAVKGIAHAHLTHDISICYKVSGSNPAVIRLYGVFTHDELGTGSPANDRKQKSVAKKMSNQQFADAPEVEQPAKVDKNIRRR